MSGGSKPKELAEDVDSTLHYCFIRTLSQKEVDRRGKIKVEEDRDSYTDLMIFEK